MHHLRPPAGLEQRWRAQRRLFVGLIEFYSPLNAIPPCSYSCIGVNRRINEGTTRIPGLSNTHRERGGSVLSLSLLFARSHSLSQGTHCICIRHNERRSMGRLKAQKLSETTTEPREFALTRLNSQVPAPFISRHSRRFTSPSREGEPCGHR